jgi:hypothetical protein
MGAIASAAVLTLRDCFQRGDLRAARGQNGSSTPRDTFCTFGTLSVVVPDSHVLHLTRRPGLILRTSAASSHSLRAGGHLRAAAYFLELHEQRHFQTWRVCKRLASVGTG